MKIRLLNNLPYNNNKENVPLFNNQTEVDEWIDNNLINKDIDWVQSKSFKKFSPTEMTFKMASSNIAKGFSYSYCATEIQGKIEYWHIAGTYSPNGKTITYQAKLDIYMTYPLVLSEIEQGVMSQGHIPFEKMLGLTFDGGDKVPVNIETLQRKENEATAAIPEEWYNNSWLYVFVKQKDSGKHFETEYSVGEYDENFIFQKKWVAPYGIFVAPVNDIQFQVDGNLRTFNAQKLMEDLNDLGYYPYILGTTVSHVCPAEFNYEYGTRENIQIDKYTGGVIPDNKFLMELSHSSRKQYDLNTFELTIEKDIANLDGVRNWEIFIENNKEFVIPPKAYENGKLEFIATFVPTPNEPEESIMIVSDSMINIRNENNTWAKKKDIIYGVSAFDTYKANSPITSSLELVLNPIKGALTGSSMTTWFMASKMTSGKLTDKIQGDGRFIPLGQDIRQSNLIGNDPVIDMIEIPGKTSTALSTAGKFAVGFGAIGAGRALASTVIKRQDIRHRPDNIVGSGSAMPDLLFNNEGFKITKVEYEFTTTERDNVLNSIYRDGVLVENYVFDKLENIKRERFNVLDVVNIDMVLPKKYYQTEGLEVINEIINFYNVPRRYWTDKTNFMVFDYNTRKDN